MLGLPNLSVKHGIFERFAAGLWTESGPRGSACRVRRGGTRRLSWPDQHETASLEGHTHVEHS